MMKKVDYFWNKSNFSLKCISPVIKQLKNQENVKVSKCNIDELALKK